MRITVFCPQRRLLKFHVARKKLQYREFYSLQLLAIFRWSKDFRGGKGKGKLIKIDISRKLETRDTLNSFQTCSSTSTIRYNKEKNLYVEIDNFSNFSINSRKIRILSIEEKVHNDFFTRFPNLNITMNDYFAWECSNRSSVAGSNRKSRVVLIERRLRKKKKKKKKKEKKIRNRDVHETKTKSMSQFTNTGAESRCQWSKKKVPLFLGLRDPYRSLLLYR